MKKQFLDSLTHLLFKVGISYYKKEIRLQTGVKTSTDASGRITVHYPSDKFGKYFTHFLKIPTP